MPIDLTAYRARARKPTSFDARYIATAPTVAPYVRIHGPAHKAPDRNSNAIANPTRSYHVETMAEALLIEYGPGIFRSLSRPRGKARFA